MIPAVLLFCFFEVALPPFGTPFPGRLASAPHPRTHAFFVVAEIDLGRLYAWSVRSKQASERACARRLSGGKHRQADQL